MGTKDDPETFDRIVSTMGEFNQAWAGKAPVLKNKVHSWLVQKNEVLAFVQAKPADGGAGALVVLLTPGQPAK